MVKFGTGKKVRGKCNIKSALACLSPMPYSFCRAFYNFNYTVKICIMWKMFAMMHLMENDRI